MFLKRKFRIAFPLAEHDVFAVHTGMHSEHGLVVLPQNIAGAHNVCNYLQPNTPTFEDKSHRTHIL